jgi:IclR family acetate operon transcriptional repressor
MRVLEALAESGEAHGVSELAAQLELPRSHVHRLLQTLTSRGYVERAEARQYRISGQVLCLANAFLERLAVRQLVRPYMRELAESVGGAANLAIPVHGEPITVDVLHPTVTTRDVPLAIGRALGIGSSASGRICLAYVDDSTRDRLLADHATGHSPAEAAALAATVAATRAAGAASIGSETGTGSRAAAAPLFSQGHRFVGILGVHIAAGGDGGPDAKTMRSRCSALARAASFALGAPLSEAISSN